MSHKRPTGTRSTIHFAETAEATARASRIVMTGQSGSSPRISTHQRLTLNAGLARLDARIGKGALPKKAVSPSTARVIRIHLRMVFRLRRGNLHEFDRVYRDFGHGGRLVRVYHPKIPDNAGLRIEVEGERPEQDWARKFRAKQGK